ncbi:hypothetical protein ACHAWC_010169 [Mediolabrus comicus]
MTREFFSGMLACNSSLLLSPDDLSNGRTNPSISGTPALSISQDLIPNGTTQNFTLFLSINSHIEK